MSQLIPIERIENKIIVLRSEKVMLDRDLADLYGVETMHLNQAVARNFDRFPADFMFQLTEQEFADLKFHFGTSTWGGTRKLPRAFTEQGVAMLSSVLRSKRAVQVNILIMRAFVSMRQMLSEHKDLAKRIDNLEKRYDKQFALVFDAIRRLMEPPTTAAKKKFGFQTGKGEGKTEGRRR